MNVRDALTTRRAVSNFEPSYVMSDETLSLLIEPVCLTPSSFNLQHWRFVAVRDPERKRQLREVAYDQRQLEECAAAILVTGDTKVHLDASKGWKNIDPDVAQRTEDLVRQLYGDNPTMQRDEAIRSGSLAAMSMMLVATDLGLCTSPMIGFDPVKVAQILRVPNDHVCVMIICVGKAVGDPRPSTGRFDVSELVRLETFDGPGLAQ